jgi:hypothetical protein
MEARLKNYTKTTGSMKNKSTVLLLFIVIIQVSACKKDKAVAEPAPSPIAHYTFTNDWLNNSISPLLGGSGVGNLSSTTDSFKTTFAALLFNEDGYVEVKDSDLLDFAGGEFTLAAWIYPSKTDIAYVIHKGDKVGGDYSYSLSIFPGFAQGGIRSTTKETFLVTGTSSIKKNVWQHIAVTFSGKQLTIYYNGKNEGSTVVDRSLRISDGSLAIGAYAWAFPAATFKGKIDNVHIYDKALTAGQISTLFNNYEK